jgi:AraC-like DNA-binding protein
MGRPATEAASPSTLAPTLLRWIVQHGGDPSRPGWPEYSPEDLEKDELPLTARAAAAMFEAAAEIAVDPHVALRLPSELVYRRYDPVALASRAAASAEEILAVHARFAPLVFPQLEASVVEKDGVMLFEASVRGHPRGLGVLVDEYLLALLVLRIRERGSDVAPRSVGLTSARPRDLAPIYAALGCREIAFGAERTAIELATEDARRPFASGDRALMATAEHLASAALAAAPRANALGDAVRAKLDAALPDVPSADAIAALLHMSARTLQRRLELEGTRLSEIVDAVRARRARKLLEETALPLAEVAYRAGFADLATFSRAFKRWTGMPPGAFRARTRST